jgi:tetraacyldisaccharide 4'-kinase
VVVCADRVAALHALIQEHACDVVLSDDGLQHYRLARALEIAVIDGARRLGNRRCLPAGPLRESPRRLHGVDMVVAYGTPSPGEWGMAYRFLEPRPVCPGGTAVRIDAYRGRRIHAVAGIGNPQRFFDHLRSQEIDVIEHRFPDHHRYIAEDIQFADSLPVLMTEKDAVKCERIAGKQHQYLPICAELSPGFAERVLGLLRGRNDGQAIVGDPGMPNLQGPATL